MGALSKAIKSSGGDYINGGPDGLGYPIAEMVGNKRHSRRIKTTEQLQNDYQGYVYRVIDVKAQNVSAVELYTEQLIGGKWQRKSHEFEKFLNGGPGSPDLAWMRTGTVTYKQMHGEAFWYVNLLEQSRKPVDRVLLYPDRIKVIADSNYKVVGYIYTTANNNQIPLDLDEVIHFKYFNPKNHMRGFGPLQAAGLYVDSERNTMEYITTFIENNATPSGIIVLPAATAQEQFDVFTQQWRNKYGGLKNAGKTAILQADGVDFKQISSNLKDMQLSELRAMSRDDILGVFGMSKHMVGISDEAGLGRSSAEAHEYIFAVHNLVPELRAEVAVFNDAFKRYFKVDGSTWRVSFDSPVPEDKEYKLKVANEGGSFMTLNERRRLMGLDDITGGDVIVDAMGTPVADATKKAPSIKVKMKTVAKADTNMTEEAVHKNKEAYRLSIQAKQTHYERKWAKDLLPFFKEQKARVLDDLVGSKSLNGLIKSMADGNLNPHKEAKAMTELSIQTFLDMMQEQGDLAIKYAGDTEPFLITPEMRKFIEEKLSRTTQDFSDETVRGLTSTLTEGITNGESLMQLGKRVDEYYQTILGGTPDSLKGYRLSRLVRTETIKSSNQATLMGYQQLGVNQKEWFNNPGACDYCQSIQGVKGIGELFLTKGESLTDQEGNERVYDYDDVDAPPLHPNCRCAILPVRD